MSSTMQILSALAIAGALFLVASVTLAQDSGGGRDDALLAKSRLSICVSFPAARADGQPESSGTQRKICLATSANGWKPDSREFFVLCNNGLAACFDVPWSIASNPDFEFKFTRGSWDTVEVAVDGHDIPNRRITSAQLREAADALTSNRQYRIRLIIGGWADERPQEWAASKHPGSKITGDLRMHGHDSEIRHNWRSVRVWLPPGYDSPEHSDRRYPVLYMNDGQNLFDTATSFAGEWHVDETATQLIEHGVIPPMIVVGIDNAREARGDEYLPRNAGSRRPDMGGKADEYLRMIADEIMPLVNRNYRTLTGPQHTAFGGSSFGGVVTLHAAMTRPDLFGAILVESPSLWVEDGAFLQRVVECKNWPQRVYLAQGDREYGEGKESAELVEMTRKVEAAMRHAGLGEDRLMVVIGEGDAHNEAAWAKRLPAAMEFLFAPAK